MVKTFNRIWGYGQLFGYSALEGPNRYYEDNILMTMKEKLCFRFEYRPHWIKMSFPNLKEISFDAVMGDFVIAKVDGKPFKLTFLDNDTLIGLSPVLPVFEGDNGIRHRLNRNVDVYGVDNHHLGLAYVQTEEGYLFVIHHSFSESEARSGALFALKDGDLSGEIAKKTAYYEALPDCKDKRFEDLYAKALSIQRVNVKSPEGKIDDLWTTPDRVPHRHMWMWDSAFHAMALSAYRPAVAETILLSMLKQIRSDGFLPHMANPTDCSDVTQPCVMSYAAWFVYQRSKNISFLKEAVSYLERYLTYDMLNRDKNGNGLLEWKTEPDYEECKCGESGLDNSPRFDFDEEMDCIDFSTYFALDTEILSKIERELGREDEARHWEEISKRAKHEIQNLLWDEEDGVYYDRLFSGKRTKVLTPSSFLPLFAGISSKEQAERMVEVLTRGDELWSTFPLASISQKDPRFSNDMWRGGVWLNINYFIVSGLRRYGFEDLSRKLRDITLEKVNEWYLKTGTIFEFYDPKDEVAPFYCHRKGEPTPEPDYRKHVHSISDYNWSACFTMLLIQGEY